MDSDSNCVVNFVEIIHDCVPRLVDLDLTFASHGTDNLYLEVRNVIAYDNPTNSSHNKYYKNNAHTL